MVAAEGTDAETLAAVVETSAVQVKRQTID